MKMDSKTMFATMSPWKLFFAVALPGMVSMFAMSIYSIFEGIFIGQKLGEAAFAAVNIAFPLASLFVNAAQTSLLVLATRALRLFSVTYLVRWFAIFAQSFLGAIEKPIGATILSVCVALVFPVVLLGALWDFGLDGIWLNMFGTSLLALGLGIILIYFVWKREKQ